MGKGNSSRGAEKKTLVQVPEMGKGNSSRGAEKKKLVQVPKMGKGNSSRGDRREEDDDASSFSSIAKVVGMVGALGLIAGGLAISYKNLFKEEEDLVTTEHTRSRNARRINGRIVYIDKYEEMIAGDVVNLDNVDVTMESIGGLQGAKDRLNSVMLRLKRPELYKHGSLLTPVKGVLLYGPPGTGKTMLAKAIAKEANATFINVKLGNMLNKYVGESEKFVNALFSLAVKLQPTIIFIDEVDSFLRQRRDADSQWATSLKTEFMSLWDGFATKKESSVIVLAATNQPGMLDEAIQRRFTEQIEIGKPNQTERADILRTILKKERIKGNINYKRMAASCEGFTGADLFEQCKEAANFAINDLLRDESNGMITDIPRALTQSDLENALLIRRRK